MHKVLLDDGPSFSAEERSKLVQQRCHTFMQENNPPDDNKTHAYHSKSFILSRNFDLAMCYNQKVASTNTKRILYALDNNFDGNINKLPVPLVRAYGRTCLISFTQFLSLKKKTTRIVLVREPLERLLSAYRDERGFDDNFENPNFTFKQYLELILNKDSEKLNIHLYPYYERCRPCMVQYDYVILQSTFEDDMRTVLRKIGAQGKVRIPKQELTGYNSTQTQDLLKSYFKNIPPYLIHGLWEKYYKDYYIFGFPYPSHLIF